MHNKDNHWPFEKSENGLIGWKSFRDYDGATRYGIVFKLNEITHGHVKGGPEIWFCANEKAASQWGIQLGYPFMGKVLVKDAYYDEDLSRHFADKYYTKNGVKRITELKINLSFLFSFSDVSDAGFNDLFGSLSKKEVNDLLDRSFEGIDISFDNIRKLNYEITNEYLKEWSLEKLLKIAEVLDFDERKKSYYVEIFTKILYDSSNAYNILMAKRFIEEGDENTLFILLKFKRNIESDSARSLKNLFIYFFKNGRKDLCEYLHEKFNLNLSLKQLKKCLQYIIDFTKQFPDVFEDKNEELKNIVKVEKDLEFIIKKNIVYSSKDIEEKIIDGLRQEYMKHIISNKTFDEIIRKYVF